MRTSSLPTLHKFITNGYRLRNELAQSLGAVYLYAARTGNAALPASHPKLLALLNAGITELSRIAALPASIASSPVGPVALSSGTPTQQLAITETKLDTTTLVVTSTAPISYVSSNPAAATVSAGGLITRVAAGTTTITVGYYNRYTTVVVNVT